MVDLAEIISCAHRVVALAVLETFLLLFVLEQVQLCATNYMSPRKQANERIWIFGDFGGSRLGIVGWSF